MGIRRRSKLLVSDRRKLPTFLALAMVAASCGDATSAPLHAPQGVEVENFGLSDEFGPYRLETAERGGLGGLAISIDITKNGQPLQEITSDVAHIYMVSEHLSYFDHQLVRAESVDESLVAPSFHNVGAVGVTRVVVTFEDDDGFVVLGDDVAVAEDSDFRFGLPPSTQENLVITSGVLVERTGFDFTLAVPWGGDASNEDPAWLTLIRREDLAVIRSVAQLVGDRTFRFDPDDAGLGEYLAILEFTPYGYGNGSGAPLGDTTGRAYGFYVTLDATGSLVANDGIDLRTAVTDYVDAIGRNDLDAAWTLISHRCRLATNETQWRAERENERERDRWDRVISIVVSEGQSLGRATYSHGPAEYEPGRQPSTKRRSNEIWILEDARWRWNDCDPRPVDFVVESAAIGRLLAAERVGVIR